MNVCQFVFITPILYWWAVFHIFLQTKILLNRSKTGELYISFEFHLSTQL